jgi:hypothetical protein
MPAAQPVHQLYVRTPGGKRLEVPCRTIHREGLALDLAQLLAKFLANDVDDVEFVSAARWAFAVWDSLQAAEINPHACAVEVIRRTVTRAGKRSRRLYRIAADSYRPVPA